MARIHNRRSMATHVRTMKRSCPQACIVSNAVSMARAAGVEAGNSAGLRWGGDGEGRDQHKGSKVGLEGNQLHTGDGGFLTIMLAS